MTTYQRMFRLLATARYGKNSRLREERLQKLAEAAMLERARLREVRSNREQQRVNEENLRRTIEKL